MPKLFHHDNHIAGHWLPVKHADLKPWIHHRLKKIDPRRPDGVYDHPVIDEFRQLIDNDADIYMGFTQMFEAQPADALVRVPCFPS